MDRQVTRNGDLLVIKFDYDPDLVDLVKTLPGRRWDPERRQWTVPLAYASAVVALLEDKGFTFDEGLRTAPAHAEAPDLTVSALNTRVQAALNKEFPTPVWVVGEILGYAKSLAKNKDYLDFQLVEREAGRIKAAVEAVLFRRERERIEKKLQEAGNPYTLQDELTVRVLAQVDLWVREGRYRLVIQDLDVNYTLGEAARRREEILRKLAQEGLLELNRKLPFPLAPLRVGLITSLGSDAERDVLKTLSDSGFAFQVVVHGARVQGHYTEPSILNALDWFRARAEEFDVVLICRGGGSRADLAWFDSEALGRAVATFPLPVVVGIGHEQDRSVLDEVGWRQKTPTAAAQFLVDRVQQTLETMEQNLQDVVQRARDQIQEARQAHEERVRRLGRIVRHLLEQNTTTLHSLSRQLRAYVQGQLESARRQTKTWAQALPQRVAALLARRKEQLRQHEERVQRASERELADAQKRLQELVHRLGPRVASFLRREGQQLEARAQRLQALDPRRVVERGFALLRLVDGRVVKSVQQAPAGTLLRAQLRDGVLRVRSQGEERGEHHG